MTGGRDGDEEPDRTERESGSPVDFTRLAVVEERLGTDDRFVRITPSPEFAPDRIVCDYDPRLYPAGVEAARLEIVWFENGDFSIHYHETHAEGTFDHRWDRHPSQHNTRDHVHPGPDAPTPGTDATHPRDWRDVLSKVLSEVEERQRAFWIQ